MEMTVGSKVDTRPPPVLDVCTEEGSENERHFSLRKPQRRAGPGGWTGHSEKMQNKGV